MLCGDVFAVVSLCFCVGVIVMVVVFLWWYFGVFVFGVVLLWLCFREVLAIFL